MCQLLPTKGGELMKYFLLIIIVFYGILSASPHFFAETSFFLNEQNELLGIGYPSNSYSGKGADFYFNLYDDFGRNFSYEINNYLFQSDNNFEERNAEFYNNFSSIFNFNEDYGKFHLKFSNRTFQRTDKTYILSYEHPVQQKFVNNFSFAFVNEGEFLSHDFYLHYANYHFNSLEDGDFVDNDLISKYEISYNDLSLITPFFSIFHKNDLNKSKNLNYTEISSGIKFFHKIKRNIFVEGKTAFYHNPDSQFTLPHKKMGFLHEFRINHFLYNFNYFVTFSNESFFDEDEMKFYWLRNVLRLQGKYSWLIDKVIPSSISGGIKTNAEFDELRFFSFGKQFVGINSAIIFGHENNFEDFHKSYLGAETIFNNQKIWVKYYFYNETDYLEQSVIYLGTTLIDFF